MNRITRIIFLLYLLLHIFTLQAQDSIPLKKWQGRKIGILLTAASCCAPRIYGEGVVNDRNNNTAFGGNYLINFHFTKHLGLTWGFGILTYKKSFGQITPPANDTANFTSHHIYLKFPLAFLWDINPVNKVKCFINTGISLTGLKSSPHYEGGSLDWMPPSRIGQFNLRLNYNLSAGIKIPVYKSFDWVIMLQYEDSFLPISIFASDYHIFTKTRFFSLHIGLCL